MRIVIEYNDDHNIPISTAVNNAVDASSNAVPAPYTIRIVNFRVEPHSVQHTWTNGGKNNEFVNNLSVLSKCPGASSTKPGGELFAPYNPYILTPTGSSQVVFTYEVVWEKSETLWANRWDLYLTAANPNDRVHWYSICNSIVIVLFLSLTIGAILFRALRKDIAQV